MTMNDNVISIEPRRRTRARASRVMADRAHMETILAHLAKELSWCAYKMLKDGKVLYPRADHDEAMAFSETVAEALSEHFHEMVVELYG